MEKPYILHMLTSAKNLSPFDVNMALDAGWEHTVSYCDIDKDEVRALVQDAIFSRGPTGVRRTGIFLGGRDMHLAVDMLGVCRQSMVPPFEVSCFADPSGAFTTAAGVVACAEKALQDGFSTGLKSKQIIVLGGTGPVGSTAAILAARAGAAVTIMGRNREKSQQVASLCNHRYGKGSLDVQGEANDAIGDLMRAADVVFAAAAAGVQIISEKHIEKAGGLKIAADVNAVPPSGIAGLEVTDDCAPVKGSGSGAVGIGALAIGNVKYQTQHKLLQEMRNSEKPVYLDFERAFEIAREIAQG